MSRRRVRASPAQPVHIADTGNVHDDHRKRRIGQHTFIIEDMFTSGTCTPSACQSAEGQRQACQHQARQHQAAFGAPWGALPIRGGLPL